MVRVYDDLDALSRAAAEVIARAAEQAVRDRGRFTIALAGGSTPRHLYQLLASAYRDAMPWSAIHIFFGDERCVPPTDAASNYRMANDALLSHVPIPEAQVHRIRGELASRDAAREYGKLLRRVFGTERAADGAGGGRTGDLAGSEAGATSGSVSAPATFDVVLLGVGPDGHTASLFPGTPVLEERKHWVMEVDAPDYIAPPRERVTLTFPPLNASRTVLFLVAGEEKQRVVTEILGADARTPTSYPAARVHGRERTVWLLDRVAAGTLDAAQLGRR
ncbi:MAG TPA: 6-phosphogluconolactonase [Gemmatimonadaceae bacterium]|jgi:6-phosphogluconolactonase|nr:6-phosphogluconolactonase [Gemmatimonadaceae bacterium]